ncbi:MAG: thiamine phosphate synthase [Alphaproteobacteria bacterium]
MSGGDVATFQLRLKDADDTPIRKAAAELIMLCEDHGVAFILNDRPDLAAEMGADGVHLGVGDMPIGEARAIVGDEMIIGASAHASRHLALEAGEAGADYVAFGAFYPTQSKPKEKVEKWGIPTPEILTWWQAYLVLPCVAIGGITPANCAPLITAGADFIAAITAVWKHPKGPKMAVEEFNEAILAVQRGKEETRAS